MTSSWFLLSTLLILLFLAHLIILPIAIYKTWMTNHMISNRESTVIRRSIIIRSLLLVWVFRFHILFWFYFVSLYIGCMLCMLLFYFVNYVFYYYAYIFFLLCLCILVVMYALCSLSHCVVLCTVYCVALQNQG